MPCRSQRVWHTTACRLAWVGGVGGHDGLRCGWRLHVVDMLLGFSQDNTERRHRVQTFREPFRVGSSENEACLLV